MDELAVCSKNHIVLLYDHFCICAKGKSITALVLDTREKRPPGHPATPTSSLPAAGPPRRRRVPGGSQNRPSQIRKFIDTGLAMLRAYRCGSLPPTEEGPYRTPVFLLTGGVGEVWRVWKRLSTNEHEVALIPRGLETSTPLCPFLQLC